MLQQEQPDDFVVATGQTHTVREFLETVFNYADLQIDKHVEIDKRLLRPQEVPLLLGDPSKAEEKLGWTPTVTFSELAKMMYDSDLQLVKEQINGIKEKP
jgi:GDPmannose 4,6-dehydratase